MLNMYYLIFLVFEVFYIIDSRILFEIGNHEIK